MPDRFAFESFELNTQERRLTLGDEPVELNGRYLDALALLVSDGGKLVSKDRFLAEVWRGVPVTDEALTQCIKTLRRQLGDDAARPRFIETVPKHGYRFIAPVSVIEDGPLKRVRSDADPWRQFLLTGTAGTLGGALAGAIGGLVYGFAAASRSGGGGISALLVLLSVTLLVGLIGAAGVSFAIATAAFVRNRSWQWLTLSGAVGGLFVGALGKLLGRDSFTLLVGRSPGDITGAMEGALLGLAVGLGAWLGLRSGSTHRGAAIGGSTGAIAGLVIAALGGRLMLGSLALLAVAFPGSRLHLDPIWELFGETGFGPVARFASNAVEGGLFSGCIVAAILLARRWFASDA